MSDKPFLSPDWMREHLGPTEYLPIPDKDIAEAQESGRIYSPESRIVLAALTPSASPSDTTDQGEGS